MRKRAIPALLIVALAPTPASAAVIIIYQDPMTMDRRTVVRESPGPDRAYWCMLPPSDIGCVKLDIRRGR